MEKLNKSELKPGFHIFGNKGNVWSDTAHISDNSFSGRTLCGVPMLSNNWARIDDVQNIGCTECLKKYKEITEL